MYSISLNFFAVTYCLEIILMETGSSFDDMSVSESSIDQNMSKNGSYGNLSPAERALTSISSAYNPFYNDSTINPNYPEALCIFKVPFHCQL